MSNKRSEHDEAEEEDYVPVKIRKLQHISKIREAFERERAEAAKRSEDLGADDGPTTVNSLPKVNDVSHQHSKRTLLATSQRLRAEAEKNQGDAAQQEIDAVIEEEQRILEQVQRGMNAPLMSVKERAKGIVHTERLSTDWTLPRKYASMSSEEANQLRDTFFIDVNGVDVPPPIRYFKDMRLPKSILKALSAKGISQPTQIQMQGLPAVFQGRDLIGIAFTGTSSILIQQCLFSLV